MSHDDRERKFEKALQRQLRRDSAGARNEADALAAVPDEAAGAVECPDAATLGAFHEDTLSNEEMKATTEHIAGCPRCQQILLLLEATDEIPLPLDADKDLKIRESVLSTSALYVDYSARETPSLAVAGQPTPASKAPQDISRGRGFKALRWAAPAGAIAAGLLIWLVVRDNKVQNTHLENVQVAQQQSTEERPATPQALPALPAPEVIMKNKDLNERLRGESRAKQPAKESGALHAQMEKSSAAIANEAGVAADRLSTRANADQLQAKSGNFSARETVVNKLPEILPRQADGAITATAPPPRPAPSMDALRRSAAPSAKADAKENANATSTIETDTGGTNQFIPTEQVATSDKLEPRAALKGVGLENPKIILASNGTVRWRALSAGRIEQSVDNGITWMPQKSEVKVELLAGSAPSEAVCWIVGRSGTVLRTTDGGGHWSKVVSPIRGDVAGVQAVDAMTAEIYDAKKSSRFVTHDGGATWQAVNQ